MWSYRNFGFFHVFAKTAGLQKHTWDPQNFQGQEQVRTEILPTCFSYASVWSKVNKKAVLMENFWRKNHERSLAACSKNTGEEAHTGGCNRTKKPKPHCACMYIHRIFPPAPIITSIKKINHIFQTRKITSLLWDRTGKLLHWGLLPSMFVILSARSKRESNLTVKCKDSYAEELPILVQVAHDHTTYLTKTVSWE